MSSQVFFVRSHNIQILLERFFWVYSKTLMAYEFNMAIGRIER